MKRIIFFLLITSIFACKKETTSPSKIEKWTLKSEQPELVKIIQSTSNPELSFSIESQSLCPGYGLEYTISSDNTTIAKDTVLKSNTDPFQEDFQIPKNSEVTIRTKIVDIEPAILCVWLGEVDCTIEY